jgi:hypothetical protein
MRRTARFADAATGVWSSTITLHLRPRATRRQPAVASRIIQELPDTDALLDQPDGHAVRAGSCTKHGLHPPAPRPRPVRALISGAASGTPPA